VDSNIHTGLQILLMYCRTETIFYICSAIQGLHLDIIYHLVSHVYKRVKIQINSVFFSDNLNPLRQQNERVHHPPQIVLCAARRLLANVAHIIIYFMFSSTSYEQTYKVLRMCDEGPTQCNIYINVSN